MTKLKNLISEIYQFGINPKVEIIDKEIYLKKLLVEIYLEFLNIDFELYTEDYPEPPDFNYDNIYKKVQSNFPNFGWYSEVLDSNVVEPNVAVGIGDEVHDLADIIDLLEVEWRLENTSEKDALWHFQFLMHSHSEQHLINLLKRLKEGKIV